MPLSVIEETALKLSILPRRYMRNGLSCKQQLRLFLAKVSIIGCGGLGGSVAESLARIGFGNLRLVDPDRVFQGDGCVSDQKDNDQQGIHR